MGTYTWPPKKKMEKNGDLQMGIQKVSAAIILGTLKMGGSHRDGCKKDQN